MSGDCLLASESPPESWSGPDVATIISISSALGAARFSPDQECILVVQRALRFLALGYEQSEELTTNTVDCSTLTSQSHWEGAVVGIPFVAESQRTATSARTVHEPEELLPGDVLVKYSSLRESPDPAHNHVGIFVGADAQNEKWLVESVGGHGGRLTRLAEFGARGGIRRFLPAPLVSFGDANAKAALRLAKRVPKLGRFGARQYTTAGQERRLHLGVDIYVPAGTPVVAPLSGTVRVLELDGESAGAVHIQSVTGELLAVLGHVEPRVANATTVTRGQFIGEVTPGPLGSIIRYAQSPPDHLHFSFASRTAAANGNITHLGWIFHNGLYACKTGSLAPPLNL
jgi:murein DD-endopeptidase MepM/ murein hydrolase activator NlpD